jgi:hypothetical protein
VISRKVTFNLVGDVTTEAAAQYPNASLDDVIAARANRKDLSKVLRHQPQAIRQAIISSAGNGYRSKLENESWCSFEEKVHCESLLGYSSSDETKVSRSDY